jgi:hypothetical protein
MDLVLNPSLRITPIDEQGPAYAISAPVRGRGLRMETISRANHRELFELLDRLLGRAGDQHVELTDDHERALRRLGIFIPPREVPRGVQLLHLPGRGSTRSPRRKDPVAALQLNPAARFGGRDEVPGFEQDPMLGERISSQHPRAWVAEHRTGALVPVHLGSRHLELLDQLSGTRGARQGRYPSALVSQLEAAGLLLPRSGARRLPVGPSGDERQSFLRHGYARVDGLFSRSFCLALSTYFRGLRAQGFLRAGDAQVPLRHVLHDESVTSFLHRQLPPFVSALVGCQVRPSYCYLAEYMPGAVLKRHVDRPQCEFTISLLVDFSPRPEGRCSWPLWLSPTGKERIGIRLAIGDAVIYKGREISHWRHALAAGKRSISIFFHFVPESFKDAPT